MLFKWSWSIIVRDSWLCYDCNSKTLKDLWGIHSLVELVRKTQTETFQWIIHHFYRKKNQQNSLRTDSSRMLFGNSETIAGVTHISCEDFNAFLIFFSFLGFFYWHFDFLEEYVAGISKEILEAFSEEIELHPENLFNTIKSGLHFRLQMKFHMFNQELVKNSTAQLQ